MTVGYLFSLECDCWVTELVMNQYKRPIFKNPNGLPRFQRSGSFGFLKKEKSIRRTQLIFYFENKKRKKNFFWSPMKWSRPHQLNPRLAEGGYLWELHHLFLCRSSRNFSHVNKLVFCFGFSCRSFYKQSTIERV